MLSEGWCSVLRAGGVGSEACVVCTEDWGVRSVGKSLNYESNATTSKMMRSILKFELSLRSLLAGLLNHSNNTPWQCARLLSMELT